MKALLYPFLITSLVILVTFGLFEGLETYFPQQLKALNGHAGSYASVSFLVLAGDILLPVPSSIVMYLNGLIVGPLFGTLLSFSALMVGSVVGYFIGKMSAGIAKKQQNEQASLLLEKYGPAILVLTRGIPVISESLCFVCGFNRIHFRRYLLYSAIGYLPVCLVYALFGSMGKSDAVGFLWSFAASFAVSGLVWYFSRRLMESTPKKIEK